MVNRLWVGGGLVPAHWFPGSARDHTGTGPTADTPIRRQSHWHIGNRKGGGTNINTQSMEDFPTILRIVHNLLIISNENFNKVIHSCIFCYAIRKHKLEKLYIVKLCYVREMAMPCQDALGLLTSPSLANDDDGSGADHCQHPTFLASCPP